MIRLFELRSEKKLSQREIAKLLFISQGTYNNWENEKTQPSIEQLILLSKIFGVSIDYIVGNDDQNNTYSPPDNRANERAKLLANITNEIDKLKSLN